MSMDFRTLFRYSEGSIKMNDGKVNAAQIRVGCQTNAWPVDPSRPETLFAALGDIHQLGFSGFETGFRNILPIAEQPAILYGHQQGLTFFGVHIFLHEYAPETRLPPVDLVLKVATAASNLDSERLIVSGAPALKSGQTGSAQAKAAALNEIATRIKPFGLKLAYHNHGPEFAGPQPEIETLLSATDPSLVWFVLDAGHAFRAGVNPAAFVARHSDRLTGIHLRDFKAGAQVPLGKGDFPLAEVAAALKRENWSGWVLAEEEREDSSKPGLSAAKPARNALKAAFGI
jgi:sugar phosphate isomerase/epimerase